MAPSAIAAEVLQTFQQTNAGMVQAPVGPQAGKVTAFLPSVFPAEQQMVLTSGADARVEALGRARALQDLAATKPSKNRKTDDVAGKFTDSTIAGQDGCEIVMTSSGDGINLRRSDGSALSMKNLREPMTMENVTCAYWDEEEHRWSAEGVTTKGTSNGELRCETTHLSVFAGDVVPVSCEVSGSWAADGIAALFDAETTSKVLGPLERPGRAHPMAHPMADPMG
eukprot:Skav212380  [mRNA]  locus=scaffold1983:230729:235905:- [translate_table: standard]